MITTDQVRALALSHPETLEADHHGRPSFRVAGKIFATLWSADQLNLMLDEAGIHTAVQAWPDSCHPGFWGRRLAAVQVDLRRADETIVAQLLTDAWENKAPQRLQANR
jgi:hypothetical protein